MENLVIISLATMFASSIIVEQKVLSPLRVRWQDFLMFRDGFAKWLLELLGCRTCTGFWVGQVVALATIGSLYDGWSFELHLVGFAAGGVQLAWLELLVTLKRPTPQRALPPKNVPVAYQPAPDYQQAVIDAINQGGVRVEAEQSSD